MSTGRKGPHGKKNDLYAVARISMAWTREQMFADPRVVALDEADIIDGYTKKADIIAALNVVPNA